MQVQNSTLLKRVLPKKEPTVLVNAKVKPPKLILTVKGVGGAEIDSRTLDRFARIRLHGFLQPQNLKKNQVEYTAPVSVPMKDRLGKPMNKREFLMILEQLVVSIQKLENNKLFLGHLVLDMENVYINEATKELQLLYIPLTEKSGSTDVEEFIQSFVYAVKMADEKDMDYISRFHYHMRAKKHFSLEHVEKFVEREDPSVVNTVLRQYAGQSGPINTKPDIDPEATNRLSSFFDDTPFEGTMYIDDNNDGTMVLGGGYGGDDDGTTILGMSGQGNIYNMSIDDFYGIQETGLLMDNGLMGDETGLLTETPYAPPPPRYPKLYRVLTQEEILINKPVFRLGKERSYVDYFVGNNPVVSRSHADIITRNGRYYVKDLNSKNHTYVNGDQIPEQCEVELHNGDTLKLANEEFRFSV